MVVKAKKKKKISTMRCYLVVPHAWTNYSMLSMAVDVFA